MRLMLICLGLLPSIFALRAAELSFDWSRVAEGELPPGWRATLTGGGDPAKWAVVPAR